jgi:AcrR family transcriptional regulator
MMLLPVPGTLGRPRMPVVLEPGSRSQKMSRPLWSTTDDRRLLLGAARALLVEGGMWPVTAARVCAWAGLSLQRFRVAFPGDEEMALALFDQLSAELAAEAAEAYGIRGTWIDRVRAGLERVLVLLDERPAVARFLVVSSLEGEAPMLCHRAAAIQALVVALEAGSPPIDTHHSQPPVAAEAVVGTIAAVLHARLREEPVPALRDLCGPLMGVIALSRLGIEDALAELNRRAENG